MPTIPAWSETQDTDDRFYSCDLRENYVLRGGCAFSSNAVFIRAPVSIPTRVHTTTILRNAASRRQSLALLATFISLLSIDHRSSRPLSQHLAPQISLALFCIASTSDYSNKRLRARLVHKRRCSSSSLSRSSLPPHFHPCRRRAHRRRRDFHIAAAVDPEQLLMDSHSDASKEAGSKEKEEKPHGLSSGTLDSLPLSFWINIGRRGAFFSSYVAVSSPSIFDCVALEWHHARLSTLSSPPAIHTWHQGLAPSILDVRAKLCLRVVVHPHFRGGIGPAPVAKGDSGNFGGAQGKGGWKRHSRAALSLSFLE
ncbi:hypothetical protein DFH06DRAFT_564525 [Mycena polygramma]|nr:hypothetical protein DFH06DRAFT_564525 [Mycena polygramma]